VKYLIVRCHSNAWQRNM